MKNVSEGFAFGSVVGLIVNIAIVVIFITGWRNKHDFIPPISWSTGEVIIHKDTEFILVKVTDHFKEAK